jgi:hypothetical protein
MKTTNFKSMLVTLAVLLFSLQGFSITYYAGTRIDLTGATSSDQMWVFGVPGTTRGFDNGWDGYKMTGTVATQIYAVEAAGNFQVDAVPDMNNTYIAFQAGTDTQYTMTFVNQALSPTYTSLYLVDSVANKTVNIFTSGTTYTFTATNTTPVRRFKLLASSAIPPTCTSSASSLTDFSYLQDAGPSAEKSFTLSAANLTSNLVVTAPTDYEISLTSGSGFSSSPLSIAPVSGTVNPINVFARLKSGLAAGTYSENISVTSTNVTTIDVALTGSVTVPPPVVHKITISNAGKIVTVKNADTVKGTLTIYLASTGKLQKTYSFNAKSTTSFSTGLKAGTYVAKGVTSTDNVSTTIIIQ